MTEVCAKFVRHLPLALCLSLVTAPALAQEDDIKVSKVTLRVKEVNSWVTSAGRLFKLTEKGRTHAADIDTTGKLDTEVKCRSGDRFEADAESYFDRPTPPPRLTCKQEMVFQFARAVYADWTKTASSPADKRAVGAFVFSELSTRSSKSGKFDASAAFSDAAIASTAQLLGDDKLDRYVIRDPDQDFKLVFNPAGIEALRVKQRGGGIKPTGQLDAATQSLFLKDMPALTGGKPFVTPAIKCDQRPGQLVCVAAGTDQLPTAANPVVTLPAFEVRPR